MSARLADLLDEPRVLDALPGGWAWRPYPTVAERTGWADVDRTAANEVVRAAEAGRGAAWPPLPARLYAEYRRVGDRARFQTPYYERRSRLGTLVLAECVSGQGRFLDDAVDGIWAICEESTWCLPAHGFSGRHPEAPLPDVEEPVVDLFAAETGATLAWAAHLLAPVLEGELSIVPERVRGEVRRRLLEPYATRDDWVWLRGREPERGPNNWNPWIHSNLLRATLLLEDDPEARAVSVARLARALDIYLEHTPADGGCDEGASYWWRAAGSLFDFLETLHEASGGKLDGFRIERVRELGRYFHRMHVGGPWYVNFGDGEARQAGSGELLFRFGRRVEDPEMVAHALSMRAHQRGDTAHAHDLSRRLAALRDVEYATAPPADPPLVRDTWLPDVHVLACRHAGGTTEGLFLAAKGAHNDESHNHDDVGTFVVGLDGQPVLVDAGVGVYTRQTFGPNRYEIWTMRSAYHNVPLIDGHEQPPGARYRASDVVCSTGDGASSLRLDLAHAYGPEAGVRRWTRELRLERDGEGRIVITDGWELRHTPAALALPLLSWPAPDTVTPGTLAYRAGARSLLVRFDPALLEPEVERIDLDDPRLAGSWGPALHRTLLRVIHPTASGSWTLHLSASGPPPEPKL